MSLNLYEYARRSLEPFLPPIYRQVRVKLLEEVGKSTRKPLVLDVGGRKSPYTIGVPALVAIIDLPRETEIQKSLNLGITETASEGIRASRSNVTDIIFGDMTRSDLPTASFDIVVSVEVLEHVEEDERFVSEISRVLKPGGRFIMTTPNGDFVANHNPDHKRHYKKQQLEALLGRHFGVFEVEYAIAGGYFRRIGLRPWSVRKPIQTALSAIGNLVNAVQSSAEGIETRANNTHHLLAIAKKPGIGSY